MDTIVWNLIAKNNSFIVKRGTTAYAGRVLLSSESGNLSGKHAFSSSGLAKQARITVSAVDGGVSVNGAAPLAKFEQAKEAVLRAVQARPDLRKTALSKLSVAHRDAKVHRHKGFVSTHKAMAALKNTKKAVKRSTRRTEAKAAKAKKATK